MPINWTDVPQSQWANPPAGAVPMNAANLGKLMVTADAGAAGTPTGDALDAIYGNWAASPTGTDDTAAVLAAATTGRRLRPGTYVVDQVSLPAGAVLVGSGSKTILKKKPSTTGAVLYANAVNDLLIADLLIDGNRTNAASSTDGVHIEGCTDVTIRSVRVQEAVVSGLLLKTSSRLVVIGGEAINCLYGLLIQTSTDYRVDGFYVQGSRASTTYEGGVYVTDGGRGSLANVHVRSAAGHGFSIGGAVSDLSLTGCIASNCGTAANDHRGFSFGDTATQIYLAGCLAVGNVECGYYAVSTVTNLTLTGCEARGNNTGGRPGGHGFEILSPRAQMTGCTATGQLGGGTGAGGGFFIAQGATVTGCKASSNSGNGFTVYDATWVSISGCVAHSNSQAGVGLYHGLRAFGDYAGAVLDLTITGFIGYDDQATKTQAYAVSIESNVDRYAITGCSIRAVNNATGGLYEQNASTANKAVANNLT